MGDHSCWGLVGCGFTEKPAGSNFLFYPVLGSLSISPPRSRVSEPAVKQWRSSRITTYMLFLTQEPRLAP